MPEPRKYGPEREISSNRWRECFSLGGALQDLEERTLGALEDAEAEAAKMRRTWKEAEGTAAKRKR